MERVRVNVMKRCMKCGLENKVGSFCQKCGGSLASSGGLKGSMAGPKASPTPPQGTPPPRMPHGGQPTVPPSHMSPPPRAPHGGQPVPPSSHASPPPRSPHAGQPATPSSYTSPPPRSPHGSQSATPSPHVGQPAAPSPHMSQPRSPHVGQPASPSPHTSLPRSPHVGKPSAGSPHMSSAPRSPHIGSPPRPPHGGTSLPHSPHMSPPPKKSSISKMMLAGVLGGLLVLVIGIVLILALGNRGETDVADENDYLYADENDLYEEDEYEDEEDENDELAPLTAREVYEANVDAVFTVFMRIPDYWSEAEIAEFIRYPLFLPTGSYIPIGSGFFVDDTGVAVTNHHVVVGLEDIVARTHDGDVYDILGYYIYDTDNDIAVIQVDGSGFTYTTFTEIPIEVADYVFAIGSSDGDPNTFTSGVISRFADEVTFGGDGLVYTVTDMLQFTAPIYGGNSGGPLFNQFGQVVGVVSAGSITRPSVGFAVRIERVDLDEALSASVSSFPLGDGVTVTAAAARDYYEWFPTVPTFESVSNLVEFIGGGFGEDLGLDFFGYERIYLYDIPEESVQRAVDDYEDALFARGFEWQDVHNLDEGSSWVFFYNEREDISVSLWYLWDDEEMLVAIGYGNIFEESHSAERTRNEAFVGTWDWDMDDDYTYVFNADGTGTRGFSGNIIDFNWRTEDGNLFIQAGFVIESWSYTIAGNVLTIDSNQIRGMRWSYVRR